MMLKCLLILLLFVTIEVKGQITADHFECSRDQWQCGDGTCIPSNAKCDGHVDCTDRSDETFKLCRQNECPSTSFRCAYGACVNGTASCNNVTECADNSDELLFRCLKETDRTRCSMTTLSGGPVLFSCQSTEFECDNGMLLYETDRCDGKVDCSDGSDETVVRCAEAACDGFRCAYGGCTHAFAMCNGITDCADGSDESDDLCDRILPITTASSIETTTILPQSSNCILPQNPDHGTYLVSGNENSSPGDALQSTYVNFTCDAPYKLLGKNLLYCFNGYWSAEFPQCVLYCKLPIHQSVEYRCEIPGSSIHASRVCDDEEPSGATVRPKCRAPNYYYPGILSFMHCVEGKWDSVPVCLPECGRITPESKQLVIGGRSAKRGELPWHAGIYRKTGLHEQICGGSLISNTVVVSAAHCFWVDNLLPASNYAVAVGKLQRLWNDPLDVDAQISDVKDIKVPVRYQGLEANYQDDIALVIMMKGIEYRTYVRPVCVDFDFEFNKRQLTIGNMGKVAGWGLISENGTASPILKVVEIPYVGIEECLKYTPKAFWEYITSDKICAGYRNGTALCKGDSGGGLAFPESERGVIRYYLRGIVSTAPRSDKACNAFTYTSFTQLFTHQHFVKQYYSSVALY